MLLLGELKLLELIDLDDFKSLSTLKIPDGISQIQSYGI